MSRLYEAIMGLVVGDAVGVPAEFKKRDSYKIEDMTGYGTHNQPEGTWSDDSSMTLATVESIGRMGKIDPEDIMRNFYKWYVNNEFTPYGEVFDVGGATSVAMVRFGKGTPALECGGKGEMDNGNGSLMRILPLAFTNCSETEIENVSKVTHAHEISINGCKIYIMVAKKLLEGMKIRDILKEDFSVSRQYSRIHNIADLSRDEIKSTGYVVDTLEAALWCLANSESYKECILTAVNLGNDTDTVAAVAGGLAGIVYGMGGEKGIPFEWVEKIVKKEWIKSLCDNMEKALNI